LWTARVIYSNGYVKGETRAIVESAVRETGYRPNVVARALRTSRSFTLGLVVSEYRLSAFHVEIAHEVQHEALEHGYCAFTLNSGGDAEVERAGVQRFLDQHVDAVLYCTAVDPANVRLIKKARDLTAKCASSGRSTIPVVLIKCDQTQPFCIAVYKPLLLRISLIYSHARRSARQLLVLRQARRYGYLAQMVR
jgi:DNA-binding LacI/PurR family transcriptional regulator